MVPLDAQQNFMLMKYIFEKIPTGTCVKLLGKCTCKCTCPPLRIANFLKYHGSDNVKTDTWNTLT